MSQPKSRAERLAEEAAALDGSLLYANSRQQAIDWMARAAKCLSDGSAELRRLSAVEAERDALAAELERVKSAAQARKGLTPRQIAEVCGLRTDIAPAQFYLDFARAIERAHGIKEDGNV